MFPDPKSFKARVSSITVALATSLGAVVAPEAGTLTWDVVDDGAVIEEGAGTWDGGSRIWNDGSVSTTFSSGSDAIFGGGGPTPASPQATLITIGTSYDPVVNSITFNSGALYKLTDPNGNRTIKLSSGVITANSDGIIEAGITANSGITKLGAGTLQLIDNGLVRANGLTTVSAGQLILSKSGVNAVGDWGLTINGPSAGVQLLQNDQISNAATVNLLDGTFDLTTRTEQIDTFNMTKGSLLGSGTLTAPNGFFVQSGTLTANLKGGSLNKSSSGTAILAGNNSGYVGAININGGTLQVGAGGASGLLGSGSVTVASGATLSFNRGDTTASIGNKITGPGKLEVNSPGGITLSDSANDYTGGTLLTSGTLKVGAAGALPASGPVNFSGGSLALNNVDLTSSRTLGALTLTANSWLVLDPASSTHGSITFNGATRTGGQLSIIGWLGSIGSAGLDDHIFIQGAVSADFLAAVQFYQTDGVTPFGSGAQLLPGGELAPAVPEPANVALALFGGAFAAARALRFFRSKSSSLSASLDPQRI